MRLTIIDLEANVYKDFEQINALASTQTLEDLKEEAQKSFQTMQQLISLAESQLRVTEEHVSISSEQLQVQRQIAKKMLSQDEKCHQLFRLTKENKDESYEWYKNRVENRVEGTCQWFLNHENFRTWLEQDSGPLLVSADPECGKSVLAKYLIDCRLPRSATICYFFFKDQDQNTIKKALCALLHQLFSHKPSLIRYAMPEYAKNGPGLASITTSLWNILENAGQDTETGSVIFVLDALDECTESDFKALISMLKSQFQKHQTKPGKVKFLLISRPYDSVVSKFQELVDAFPYIRIPGEEKSETISQEVNRVIKHQVNLLAKEKRLTTEVRDHLEQKLLGIPHHTYLWIHLVFDYLKSQDFKKTKKGIELPITTLPESVNQAYEKILSKSKDDQMVRKALCIVLAAARPLTLAEINIAVNIDVSSRSIEDLDLETEDDFKGTLRSWCGLFISIYHGKIYFLHQTAREFLLSELSPPTTSPPQGLKWHHSISAHQAHSVLAESCIFYLGFLNFGDVALSNEYGEIDKYTDNHIFLDYLAKNWATHFHKACLSSDETRVLSALRICDPDSKSCLVWFPIYWMSEGYYYSECFHIIVTASYFGHEAVVKLLLATGKVDVDAKDGYNLTPLSWAAGNEHEAVIKLLLATGKVDVDAKDKYGRTPLSRAAGGRNEAVASLLQLASPLVI